jgi:hypothetical protein
LITLIVASGFMRKINWLKSLGYPMPPPLMLEGKSIILAATDIANMFSLANIRGVHPWFERKNHRQMF